MTDTPWHFWIVVIVGVLWHVVGVIDYTAMQYDWQPYMQLATGRQMSFMESMPNWIDGAWAISAWGGLAGMILVALRFGLAPLVLAASAIATLVVAVWFTFVSVPNVYDLAGWPGLATIWIAVLVTVLLWLYAVDMKREGVID